MLHFLLNNAFVIYLVCMYTFPTHLEVQYVGPAMIEYSIMQYSLACVFALFNINIIIMCLYVLQN